MKLTYRIDISAPREHVWQTMIGAETYNDWAKAFSEGSHYKGEWKQGEMVLFYDPDMGGTAAKLEVVDPYSRIKMRHVGIVDKALEETEPDEQGKKWIGSIEEYVFTEEDGVTTVEVHIETDESFRSMFDGGWLAAMKKLKEVVEGSL